MLAGDRLSRPQLDRLSATGADSLGESPLASSSAAPPAAPPPATSSPEPSSRPTTNFLRLDPLLRKRPPLLRSTHEWHHLTPPASPRSSASSRMWDQAWYVRALPAYLITLGDPVQTSVGVQRVLRISGKGTTRSTG
jgi:hypothetical protein